MLCQCTTLAMLASIPEPPAAGCRVAYRLFVRAVNMESVF